MELNDQIIRVGILTISDTRTPSTSNIETFDSSGHILKELINKSNIIESAKVVEYECVIDDIEKIQAKMLEWCIVKQIDVLLSSGGTGFSSRDVTPEATLGIVKKLTPGISQAIMNESLKITPMAMLSRAVSGIYEKTLIINLPGSQKAAKECLCVIASVIPHAVSLIKDEKEISNQLHNQLNSKTNDQFKIPECVSKVACRHRESPFPKISMNSALHIIKQHSFSKYSECNKIMYPNIWIFSTGDELINCTEESHHGRIRDTNSIMIKCILEQDNYMGEVFNCGVVRDNWEDLCKQFEKAFDNSDIVITSGGVSMGEKDLIKHVLKEHFKSHIHFGRVDMKPGMPTTFVTLFYKDIKKYVFCLPGNPVSAAVCTHLFILPYLRSISGRKSIIHSYKAKLTHSINDLDIRPEYRRALLTYENGEFNVSCLTNYQQSSRLLSFKGSNCLLLLPSSTKIKYIKANEIMDVILIKSIENMYITPILKKKNWRFGIYHSTQADSIHKTNYQFSSVKEILDIMVENVLISKAENIPTISSMGYVLYSSVYSSENLPSFPASIKDGYALRYMNDDSWSQEFNIFKVKQVSLAGMAPNCQKEVIEGECVRISTGAPLPPGSNCVVQVEDTSIVSKSLDGKVEMTIAILKKPKPFDNIRSIGSDISVGQILIDEKTELGPPEIALLCSVGCEEVCVYRHPTIHIIPYTNTNNSMSGTSIMIKNMLKQDGFKGNIFCHSICYNWCELPEQYKNVFNCDDIIIFCDEDDTLNLPFHKMYNVEIQMHIQNKTEKTTLEFGLIYMNKKRLVFFNIQSCNTHSFHNSVHLFILPFLRFTNGRKQYIYSVQAKPTDLFIDDKYAISKFEKAELYYSNSIFNVTCFKSNNQNCLIHQSSSEKTILDVIVTENSDSYFIHY